MSWIESDKQCGSPWQSRKLKLFLKSCSPSTILLTKSRISMTGIYFLSCRFLPYSANTMNKFEEFKKSIQCSTCLEAYQNDSYKYYCTSCGYHACSTCYNGYGRHCSCEIQYQWLNCYVRNDDNTNKLLEIMEEMSIKNAEAQLENEKLKTEIVMCRTNQRGWQLSPEDVENCHEMREDHQKCIECQKSEPEQNMQLCITCDGDCSENLVERASCASCAIKKHMQHKHEIVDFYPYLRAINFKSRSPEFTLESENLKNVRDSFNTTVQKFNDLSSNASENLNVLADRARRSNSTKNQTEFFQK